MTSTAPDSARIGGVVGVNLPVAKRYEHAVRGARFATAEERPLTIRTGAHAGCPTEDRLVARRPRSRDQAWRDDVNHEGGKLNDAAARKIAGMFHDNLAKYADGVSEAVRSAGPATIDADNSAEG